MQQIDDVVAGWLSGSGGQDNPAGPLYIQGTEATEAALGDASMAVTLAGCNTLRGGTTCSYNGGCACC